MGLWVPKKVELAKEFRDRYSYKATASDDVIKAIRKIDPNLDIKMYMPTGEWHVVRYPQGFGPDKEFVRCFTLKDDEELGKQAHPGMWLVDYLNKCDTRKRNLLEETERNEAAYYREQDEVIRDIAHEMAKDLRKPLLSDIDGTVSTKTVWQVGGDT